MIGAIAQATSRMKVTTAVTCPTIRIHPAIIAQAAATSAVLLEGRFALGLGSGEALNEHILGDHWPEADERLEMLEEAVEVIRTLCSQSHRGRHYRVENARIYDLPEQLSPILISGFGSKSTDLAARIGDGFRTLSPEKEAVETVREKGGSDKLIAGGMKVCWDEDEQRTRKTAHRLWPNDGLPGELAQILPTSAHFEQASELVSEEQIAEAIPCGPDLDAHLEKIGEYEDAGFDELYVQQVGDGHERMFELYSQDILPRYNGS
jgi:G6PDH family F420-dependent oxidoreductase